MNLTPPKSPRPTFLSSTKLKLAVTVFSKAGVTLASALSAIVISKLAGQQELGYFALVRVIPAIFVLLTEFGISNSYPFLINRLGFGALQVYRSGAFSFWWILLGQICVWLAITSWLKDLFLPIYEWKWVALAGLLAPLQVIHLHAANLLRTIGRIKGANAIYLGVEYSLLGSLLACSFVQGLGNFSILACVIFSSFAVAVFSLIYLWRLGFPFTPLRDEKILKESFKYGSKTQVGNAAQVLNYRLDQLIVGGLLGASDLALYAVAAKGAELFRFFSMSIVFVVEPMLSGREKMQAHEVVRRQYPRVFIVNFLFVLVGLLIVPLLIPIFFGSWAVDAKIPFFVLSFGMIVSGANGLVAAYNFAIGRPDYNTIVIFGGLVSTVVFNVALVPLIGMIGAAWATAITQLVVSLLYLIQFKKRQQLR